MGEEGSKDCGVGGGSRAVTWMNLIANPRCPVCAAFWTSCMQPMYCSRLMRLLHALTGLVEVDIAS